jgi:hypothetical protein
MRESLKGEKSAKNTFGYAFSGHPYGDRMRQACGKSLDG